MAEACELPRENASPEEIRALLTRTQTIAVVGLSDKPDRPSFGVAEYMQRQGYRIVPINPSASEILGEKSYPDLRSAPGPFDMVNVFRKPEAVPEIVAEAIAVGAKSLWLQEGVVHNEAADQARAAGLAVVMDRCLLKEHRRCGLPARQS
ncbi:MAG TPA: CoA-binding protein [Gemmatales bacterium]|nr:CoA-binding protein [Gemmatales bacterium]